MDSDQERAIESAAFEWAVDYKPWEDGLPPQDYARYGFEQGAKWVLQQLREEKQREQSLWNR